MVTVVLAEDHEIFRQGLIALLAGSKNISVVADSGDGLETVQLIADLKPDVLVVDLALPGIDGLEVARRVTRLSPETRIIILSMHDNEAFIVQALKIGAKAYVLKNESVEDLVEAINMAMSGHRFLSRSIPQDIMDSVHTGESTDVEDPYDTLTKREREIFQFVAEGKTSPEISKMLFISVSTVDKHRSNLMGKLNRHSQTELVHYAIQRGFLSVKKSRAQR